MHVLRVRNVCEAWPAGVHLVKRRGEMQASRGGAVLVMPAPVVTEYTVPTERVLMCPTRDANPMFHLVESLWMLAGRNDPQWLDLFVSDFSARFAEPGGTMHGAYGHRWRNHWSGDQLAQIIGRLRVDPLDRRVVLGMWDPEADLLDQDPDLVDDDTDLPFPPVRDLPCNTHAYFRIVGSRLDMTVCCRSNDLVWGAYGANAVHFSVLHEYIAAMVGVTVGIYRQFSNNYHAYVATLPQTVVPYCAANHNPYWGAVPPPPIVSNPECFDSEVMDWVDDPLSDHEWQNTFLTHVARPIYAAATMWRMGEREQAVTKATTIQAWDWRQATLEWMWRRMERAAERQATA